MKDTEPEFWIKQREIALAKAERAEWVRMIKNIFYMTARIICVCLLWLFSGGIVYGVYLLSSHSVCATLLLTPFALFLFVISGCIAYMQTGGLLDDMLS